MKYCMYCGAQLKDDDVFCVYCGHKQDDIAQMQRTAQPQPVPPTMSPRVKLVQPELDSWKEPAAQAANHSIQSGINDQAQFDQVRYSQEYNQAAVQPAQAATRQAQPGLNGYGSQAQPGWQPAEPASQPKAASQPQPTASQPQAGSFNAGNFIKTLILVVLPVISIAMLFLGWVSFRGGSADSVNAIISSCAGYTDNRVMSALSDGRIAPIELSGMADSVSSIASFLSVSGDARSLGMVENIFRIAGFAVILSIIFGVIAIIFRTIRPLKNARNLDFAFFFLQIILFAFFLVMSSKINSYIDSFNNQMWSIGRDAFDLSMRITPWAIIALLCAVPSCLIDLIKFHDESRFGQGRRSPLPVITAIGSVFLAIILLGASAFLFTSRTSAANAISSIWSEGSDNDNVTGNLSGGSAIGENNTADPKNSSETEAAQSAGDAQSGADTQPGSQMAETVAAPESSAWAETSSPRTEVKEQESEKADQALISTLRSHLPIVTYAAPASGNENVYAYTDATLSTKESGSYIACYEDEILITDISQDGKALYVKYPAGNSYKSRWFAAEDIIGAAAMGKTYIASRDATSYNLSSPSGLKEQGYIGVGEEGIVIGTRNIGGSVYEFTIYPLDAHSVNGVDNVAYRIAWIRQGSYN